MSVRIIVNSTCDIKKEKADGLGLDFIPLKVIFADEEYLDGITMSHSEFYERLIESDVLPSTSQVAPYEYEKIFKDVKEKKDSAVCITLSSKLSGTFQSANIALADYEEDEIYIVDSENVCVGEQILIYMAVALRDQGKSAKEITEILEKEKKKIRVIALLDTLEYLKKGGRISSAAAFAGGMLSIKPVLAIENGEISILGKARGSKNGNNLLNEFVMSKGPIDFEKPYCLAYSGLSDLLLKKYIKDSENIYKEHTDILPISVVGSVIGTHAGPGAIAVAFFAKDN